MISTMKKGMNDSELPSFQMVLNFFKWFLNVVEELCKLTVEKQR